MEYRGISAKQTDGRLQSSAEAEKGKSGLALDSFWTAEATPCKRKQGKKAFLLRVPFIHST